MPCRSRRALVAVSATVFKSVNVCNKYNVQVQTYSQLLSVVLVLAGRPVDEVAIAKAMVEMWQAEGIARHKVDFDDLDSHEFTMIYDEGFVTHSIFDDPHLKHGFTKAGVHRCVFVMHVPVCMPGSRGRRASTVGSSRAWSCCAAG